MNYIFKCKSISVEEIATKEIKYTYTFEGTGENHCFDLLRLTQYGEPLLDLIAGKNYMIQIKSV
jgi:hypothetical protein